MCVQKREAPRAPMTSQKEDAATLMRQRVGRPVVRAGSFAIRVTSGADSGQSFTIEPSQPSRVLVGQSPSCNLRLSDRMVSRRHLAFELDGDAIRAVDLESTNGTWVNGLRIYDARLGGGESIQIGETSLSVERVGAATEVKLTAASSFGRVMGASAAMRKIYPLCKRLSESTVPLIIEGETGTGKELLAESLHEVSSRSKGPFVVFDCTAIPPNLVESALFGHERGSFTGATEARKGVFEEGHGGTLLLDEIGDLDLDLQAKLLRALERSEVKRIGSNNWVKVDVRILAATRRDLDQEVQEGRFRDDLFFRLAVTRIELPPLRRREGDIIALARHFWQRLAGPGAPPPESFLSRLQNYSWPGNVRELQNAVARRVALGDLADDGAPPSATSHSVMVSGGSTAEGGRGRMEQILAQSLPLPRARRRVVEEFEQMYLDRVLSEHNGNVARAAAAAGVARRYFRLLRARNRERQGG